MFTNFLQIIHTTKSHIFHILSIIWICLSRLISLYLGKRINWNPQHPMYNHTYIHFNQLLLYVQPNDNIRDKTNNLKFITLDDINEYDCIADFSNPLICSLAVSSSIQSSILLSTMLNSPKPYEYGIYNYNTLITLYPDIVL